MSENDGTFVKKVAVVDIGSNSTKILLAKVNSEGSVFPDQERSFPCRLISSETIETGEIGSSEVEKLIGVLHHLLEIAYTSSPDCLVLVATEAFRNAKNRLQIIRKIKSRYSLDPMVLSGEKEAKFIASGVCADPNLKGNQSFQAFDLGGGSLELVECDSMKKIFIKSLPLGALSIDANYPFDFNNALTFSVREDLGKNIYTQISKSGLSLIQGAKLVGLGGAIYWLRIILSKRKFADFNRYHTISHNEISELSKIVSDMTIEERNLEFPEIPSDRVDVLPIVCIVVEQLMRFLKSECFYHSFYNLRYGIASQLGMSQDLRILSDQ